MNKGEIKGDKNSDSQVALKSSRWSRRNLFVKMTINIILIVVVSVSATTYVSICRQSDNLEKALIQRNQLLANEICFAVKSAFYTLNWVYVQNRLKEVLDSEDLLWIKILKPDGEEYMGGAGKGIGQYADHSHLSFDETGEPKSSYGVSWVDNNVASILEPIEIANQKWFLFMGVSLQSIDEMEEKIIAQNVFWGLLILLFGGLISFFLSRNISTPIAQLARATRNISLGKFGQQIPVSSSTYEIDSLTQSFNQMSSNLGSFREELIQERDKLDKARKYLQAVVDVIADPIVAVDTNYRIVLANQAVKNFTGGQDPVAEGLKCNQVFYHCSGLCQGQDKACLLRQVVSSRGPAKTVQTLHDEKRGATIWDVTGSPVFDQEGKVIQMIQSWHDITELKRVEAELRVSEERYRNIIENATDAVYETDEKGHFTVFNQMALRITQYSEEEFLNKHYLELIRPDFREQTEGFYRSQFADRTPSTYLELPIVTKYGQERWIGQNVQLVSKEDRVLGFQAMARDITERRKAEEALEEYKANLEQMVNERTRELEEAQKELVNKAMDAGRAQLSAMVLHNIGNAITPVRVHVEDMKADDIKDISVYLQKCYEDLSINKDNLSEYVRDDPRGKEVFSYMGELVNALKEHVKKKAQVVENVDSSICYVSDILALQQAYAASEEETKELTDLNTLIEDAIQMQMGAIEKRGISVRKDLCRDLPRILIDKRRLIQVIVNLIKNSYEAIDALDSEDKERLISFKTSKAGENVKVEITDTGTGIEPGHIDSIFEFGNSGKGSTGFGLYYCKMFVERNMGTLDIYSEGRAKGTTVTITLSPMNH